MVIMKTIKQILLTIAVLFFSVTANAYDFEIDGIYYYIISATDFTAGVCKGSEDYTGDIVIPSTVNYDGSEYSVTRIAMSAFSGCTSLTSIEIPNSVTSISKGANYETIAGSFENCTSLISVTFEEDSQLTIIEDRAFYGCTSLINIEIPNSVTSIGGFILGGAFSGCTSLTSVTFEENSRLTALGMSMFCGCTSLTSIEIPNTVTSIPLSAFSSCKSLTSIEIPSGVTSIGISAFYSCSSLTSIEIPSGVTSIGDGAFSGCTSLTSIEIPNSVTSIDEDTFRNCTSLTSIEIPNSVTYIDDDAFSGCTSLKDLFIEDGYATLELEEDCLFSDCPLETIYLGRNLSFANSENSEDLPFNNIKTLKTLTVGADVTEILGNTFYDCSNLESIYMKGVPPIIADNTFSNASYYVTTLYVPEGTLAFYQTANVWKNFWNIQEYEPTSIEDVETDEVNFSITSNGISLSDSEGKPIAIYTINGILVKKIDNYTGEEITLNKGVYIVSVGNKAIKIML